MMRPFPLCASRPFPLVRGSFPNNGPGDRVARALFVLPQGAACSDPSHAVFTGLVGDQVKIAWGMKGGGRFAVKGIGPTGQRLRPLGPGRVSIAPPRRKSESGTSRQCGFRPRRFEQLDWIA